MKNILPTASTSLQKDTAFTAYDRGWYKPPSEEETKSNFSHDLLFKFLNKSRACMDVDPVPGTLPASSRNDKAVKEAAYFRYLQRLKNGIEGTPEDDWKYAEASLKILKQSASLAKSHEEVKLYFKSADRLG